MLLPFFYSFSLLFRPFAPFPRDLPSTSLVFSPLRMSCFFHSFLQSIFISSFLAHNLLSFSSGVLLVFVSLSSPVYSFSLSLSLNLLSSYPPLPPVPPVPSRDFSQFKPIRVLDMIHINPDELKSTFSVRDAAFRDRTHGTLWCPHDGWNRLHRSPRWSFRDT